MIDRLIESLNSLEVKGKQNLDILLGCILALEQLKEQIEAKKAEQEEPATDSEGVDD